MASCAESDADDDRSCAVCLTAAEDPRRIPCGNNHVFCLSCLQGLVAHAKTVKDSTFPCPSCRNRVTIPRRGGVAAFPSAAEAAGSGSSGSSHPAAQPRSKPFRRYGRPWYRPRPSHREDRDAFGFHRRDDAYAAGDPRDLFPPRAMFPSFLVGPRRPMNNPFYPVAGDRFDLQMDGSEQSRQQPDEGLPAAPYRDRFSKRFEKPFALSSMLAGGTRANLPSESYHPPPPHHHHHHDDMEHDPDGREDGRRERRRRKRKDWNRFGQPGALDGSSDDLDMDEVLLVIAQMEEEEQLAATGRDRHQQEQKKEKKKEEEEDEEKEEDEEEVLRMDLALIAESERQQEWEEEEPAMMMMTNLRSTVSSSSSPPQSQDEQEDLQAAVARSLQDEEDMLNLQMALVCSEEDQRLQF